MSPDRIDPAHRDSPLAAATAAPYNWRMARPVDFTRLTVEERLELIGDIWDSLESDEHPAPSAMLLAELEQRSTDIARAAAAPRSWHEVREDVVKRLS